VKSLVHRVCLSLVVALVVHDLVAVCSWNILAHKLYQVLAGIGSIQSS
jgi:hypothetical protein